jgi:hypothetical protein
MSEAIEAFLRLRPMALLGVCADLGRLHGCTLEALLDQGHAGALCGEVVAADGLMVLGD